MQVLFVAPTINATAVQAAEEAGEWLRLIGIASELVDADELLIGSLALREVSTRVESGDFGLICALGGDGTVLKATRIATRATLPLLGVNFGSLGFLTGARPQSLQAALQAFLAGTLAEDRRVMLEATIRFADESTAVYQALNEIVLGRSNMGRDINIDLAINGNTLPQLRADGVIVATATGSTAYALSAGGPLLTPGHEGLCVVPISAHSLGVATFVSAPEDVIELAPRPRPGQRAVINIDGQPLSSKDADKEIHSVEVGKAANELVLLSFDAPDFYVKIARSLSGGGDAT
ncbi:MAG: NAD(+)/NADH kinase [Coriobacteriales bacterium]|jgi:NAD+ kinase|nr:NAD(+)/NADH kinase [Coriobacteriales bacterium]